MMKKRYKGVISVLLLSLMLGSCGKQAAEAPELIEYMFGGENCRPVSYSGEFIHSFTYCGDITPTDYCAFYLQQVAIDKIHVSVGQYVNEGDVLVSADVEDLPEEINDLKDRLDLLQKIHTYDEEIYLLQHQQMEFELAGANYYGDKDSAKEILSNIGILEETNRYDNEKYEYDLQTTKTEIAEKTETYNNSILKAKASGYVTYIKDLSGSQYASALENIVVISNYNEPVIELNYMLMNDKAIEYFSKFETYYTMIDDVRYDLKLKEYASDENVMMNSVNRHPNIKFSIEDPSVLPEIGTKIPVFCEGKKEDPVLSVSFDSLLKDSTGTYVYVKNGDEKEQRYITTGRTNRTSTEVLSGLEEGELVYYTNNRTKPADYETIELENGFFRTYGDGKTYSKKQELAEVYYSKMDGTVLEVFKGKDSMVEKGDLIFTIQTEDRASVLKVYNDRIAELTEQNELSQKMYDKSVESLRKQIISAANLEALQKQVLTDKENREKEAQESEKQNPEGSGIITTVSGNDLETEESEEISDFEMELMQVNPYLSKQLEKALAEMEVNHKKDILYYEYECKKAKAQYNKAVKNNNGSGIISVYAGESGRITECTLLEGKKIRYGDFVYIITSTDKPYVVLYSATEMHPNQDVTFYCSRTKQEFAGKIMGSIADDRVYLSERKDKKYVTQNALKIGNGYHYIVKMDDPAFYDSMESFEPKYLDNIVFNAYVVHVRMVHKEIFEGIEYLYIWKVQDGKLVKQYVETDMKDGYYLVQYSMGNGEKAGVSVIVNGIEPGTYGALENE